MGVHPLLAQHCHLGATEQQRRWRNARAPAAGQVHVHARVARGACCGVFGVCADRVVTQLANFPAHTVPDLVQVVQGRAEDGLGITPDLQCGLGLGASKAGFTHHVAVFGQAVVAQGLHHRVAVFAEDLQHHAQFFVEQGFERKFGAACAHLARPVFAVAHVHAAVRHAVAL